MSATLSFLPPKQEIISAPFDPEQTRPFFEAQYLKDLAHLGQAEEDIRAVDLERNPFNPGGYKMSDVDIEWNGWKRGVAMGYELWGKK